MFDATLEPDPAPSPRRVPVRSRRALVVDDDPDFRVGVVAALERHGYEVVAVESGADALAFLARDTPAFVLLDLQMDDMSGWEVLSMVRSNARLRGTRFVIASGLTRPALPRGVPFLQKPFTREQLLRALTA